MSGNRSLWNCTAGSKSGDRAAEIHPAVGGEYRPAGKEALFAPFKRSLGGICMPQVAGDLDFLDLAGPLVHVQLHLVAVLAHDDLVLQFALYGSLFAVIW